MLSETQPEKLTVIGYQSAFGRKNTFEREINLFTPSASNEDCELGTKSN
jgi:hypothetical protein